MAVNGIEIQAGQTWRTRSGQQIVVIDNDDHHKYPWNTKVVTGVYAGNHRSHTDDGWAYDPSDPDVDDLIELIAGPGFAETPLNPEPPIVVRPAIQVGQRWRTGDGDVVTIRSYRGGDTSWPWLGKRETSGGQHTYTDSGRYFNDGAPDRRDLVELLETRVDAPVAEAPAPRPPLAVGQAWRRRDGETEVIAEVRDDPDYDYPALTVSGLSYTLEGGYVLGEEGFSDLIELAQDAPAIVDTSMPVIEYVTGDRKDTNPKDAVGIRKAPMSTVSAAVMAEVGVAMLEGAAKYGRHNYRAVGVRSSVYYDAAMRHLMSWWEGEDTDTDSGMSHVTKAITTLVVLRDAMLQGKLTDDRPPRAAEFYPRLNALAGDILDRHADKTPHHYTLADELHPGHYTLLSGAGA